MRQEKARELAAVWEGGDMLSAANLSEESKKKVSDAAARLLRAFALPGTEDALAIEGLSDAALTDRLAPLFRAALKSVQNTSHASFKEKPSADHLMVKARACERAARLRGASDDTVDALWELAFWEELAEGELPYMGEGPWARDLARINAAEGISTRLGWTALTAMISDELMDRSEAWARGRWWRLMESAAEGVADFAAGLRVREGSGGASGWAGPRELEIAKALQALVELGALWEPEPEDDQNERARGFVRASGVDADIERLREQWAMNRAPLTAAVAAGRERIGKRMEERIQKSTRDACLAARPGGERMVEAVEAAIASAPVKSSKPVASNIKSRTL